MAPAGSPRPWAERARGCSLLAATAFPAILWASFGPGRNLEYEYTLQVALSLLVLLPLCGLPAWPAHGRWPLGAWFGAGLAVLALPPAALYLTGACLCNAREFWFWWGAHVLPAYVLAASAYGLVRRARARGTSAARAGVAVIVALGACFAHVAALMWFFPQKRLLHPVAGFLHGPIYDTWIALDRGVIWARAGHLALALALFCAVWVARRPWRLACGITAAVVALAAAWVAAGYPTHGTGAAALRSFLDREWQGQGFTLHYRAGPDGQAPYPIPQLYRDAQFHRDELAALIGDAAAPHVDIYAYPDATSKKLWFGGGATDVTDVFTPSVHVSAASWPHPTLRHELAHALASRVAFHGLGFHPNMAFTEGLAVALAPEDDDMSLDEGAAALIRSGRLSDVGALFSPLFWQESGARAYTVAGSFINHVKDAYGFAAVARLYAGAGWEDVFGKGKDAVIAEWRAKVLAASDGEAHAMAAEALFRYPGVWRDACPHSKATLARTPSEDPWLKALRWPAAWDPDRDYEPWRASLAPEDRTVALGRALRDGRKALRRAGTDMTALRQDLRGMLTWPPRALEDVEMALLVADAAAAAGDAGEAQARLAAILDVAKRKSLGDDLFRQAYARRRLYDELSRDAARAWQAFLAGSGPRPYDEGPWLVRYLRFRNRDRAASLPAATLGALMSDEAPADIPATFRAEWFKDIAGQAMKEGAWDLAAQAWEKAAAAAPSGAKALMAEHARRARFYAALGPLPTPPVP